MSFDLDSIISKDILKRGKAPELIAIPVEKTKVVVYSPARVNVHSTRDGRILLPTQEITAPSPSYSAWYG